MEIGQLYKKLKTLIYITLHNIHYAHIADG